MTITILLADDHPMVLQALREILEPVSEVIETATDGQALLEAVESESARRRFLDSWHD